MTRIPVRLVAPLVLLLATSCSEDSTTPEDSGPPPGSEARVVVCESFTNYSSFLCVPAAQALQQAIAEVGPEQVFEVNPHVNFPGAADPMFGFNPPANLARMALNQVSNTPTILVDGAPVPQTELVSPAAVQARIEAALGVPAPIALEVRGQLHAASYAVAVDLWGVASDISDDLYLFTWVVEREVVLNPAGPNGQTTYTNVLRQLFPIPASGGTGGEALGSIGAGEHRHFEYSYDFPAGVDSTELAAVAFIQESGPPRSVVQGRATF